MVVLVDLGIGGPGHILPGPLDPVVEDVADGRHSRPAIPRHVPADILAAVAGSDDANGDG